MHKNILNCMENLPAARDAALIFRPGRPKKIKSVRWSEEIRSHTPPRTNSPAYNAKQNNIDILLVATRPKEWFDMGLLWPSPRSSYTKTYRLKSNGLAIGWGDEQKFYPRAPPASCCLLFRCPGRREGECAPLANDFCPVLYSIHNVKVSINGIESSGEDSEVVASLYNGDVITVFREEKGFLEFSCYFFEGCGASVRDTPVTF